MNTLAEIYKRQVDAGRFCDRGTVHSYIDVYESLLARYRESATRVLELGLFDGGGLLMLTDYFHNAVVHGIDCSDQPHGGMADLRPLIAQGIHNIRIFDATDASVDAEVFENPENWFDVIIEDCSHALSQQLQLLNVWWPRVKPGGIYIIEDLANDEAIEKFSELGFEISDRRKVKNRFDDVLAIRRKPHNG